MISTPVGDAVPAGVVALESMRLIVEVVGEVSSEEVHQMRQPCITKLITNPQPLKAQVLSTTSYFSALPSQLLQLVNLDVQSLFICPPCIWYMFFALQVLYSLA